MSLKNRIAATVVATAAAATGLVGVTEAVAPTTASAATYCKNYVYEIGGSGSCVMDIQKLVSIDLAYDHALGYTGAYTVTWDGIFGPQTKTAVQAYQRYEGLTADGIVGPKTWGVICSTEWVGGGYNPVAKYESTWNSAFLAACGSTSGYM